MADGGAAGGAAWQPAAAAPAGADDAGAGASPVAMPPPPHADVQHTPQRPYDAAATRAAFSVALTLFWAFRGSESPPACHLSWRGDLDGWELWELVQRYGGYDSVTTRKLWRTVGSALGAPDICTTTSYQTKLAYETTLLPFERSGAGQAVAPPRDADVPWGRNTSKTVQRGGADAPPPAAPGRGRGRGGGGGGRGRGRKRRGYASSDDSFSDDEEALGSKRGRGRGRGAFAPPARASSSSRSRSRSPPGATASEEEGGGKEEEWVMCDACRKWRRLPRRVRAAALPERWTCERGAWGFTDTAKGTFTPLSCRVEEPTSSGEGVVPPEDGAPDVELLDGRHWVFAFASAEDAARRAPSQQQQAEAQSQLVEPQQQQQQQDDAWQGAEEGSPRAQEDG